MQLLSGLVKKNPRIVSTQWGEKRVIDIQIDGKDEALWLLPDKGESIKKGDTLSLIRDDKGKLKMIDSAPTQEKTAKGYTPLTGDTKREIAAYIEDISSLYSYCLKSVPDSVPDENRTAVATTLFLSTKQKFNL